MSSSKPEDPLLVESISQSYKDVFDNLNKSAAPAPQKQKDAPAEAKGTGAAPAVFGAVEMDELDEAWEKSFAPSPPAGKAAAPAPAAPAVSPAPPKKKKDEVDEAWERTFDIGISAPSQAPSGGGKLPLSPSAKQVGPGAPAPRFGKSHLDEERHPFAPAGEQAAEPASAEAASLRDEIEAAKRGGTQERRGIGRRAADAIDVEKQFIRVNIERLDNLMNLVGEMIVNRNRLARQVDFIKSLREELAFSQGRLLHEIKKFEEKYEYTMNV